MSEKHKDEVTGVETTGHSWDGIRELNNPLPKWWIYTFYATIVWSFAYWVVMPAWPYLTGSGWTYTQGVIGYEQRNVVTNELAAVAEGRSGAMERIATMPLLKLPCTCACNMMFLVTWPFMLDDDDDDEKTPWISTPSPRSCTTRWSARSADCAS